MCGTTGLKPTFGTVARTGVIGNSPLIDHCGPIGWASEDCAILLGAAAGHDGADAGSADRPVPDYQALMSKRAVRGLKIGVVRQIHERELSMGEEQVKLFDEALRVLVGLGCEIGTAELPPLATFAKVHNEIYMFDTYQRYGALLRDSRDELGADFRARVEPSKAATRERYEQAKHERVRLESAVEGQLQSFDVLVTIGPFGPAPRLIDAGAGLAASRPSITGPFNLTGHPALMLPCGFGAAGLPYGFQIVGHKFDESTVLALGHAYEIATDSRAARPAFASVDIGSSDP